MQNNVLPAWFRALRTMSAKWRRRNRIERFLLLEAFALLGVARFMILAVPFKWLALSLGERMSESCTCMNASDLYVARMIGQAVRSAANNTPWESVCLPQAVAAQWMLKRRRITGTLYLGVTKDDTKSENFAAHAWLRCGNVVLTGSSGHQQCTVVATFS